MKKFSVICAAALALAAPGIAQAATPDGDHTFAGNLEVRKNIPAWTTCGVTVVINVNGGVPTLKSAAVTSGGGACTAISFSGITTTALDTLALPVVTVPNLRVNIAAIFPFPADACEGPVEVVWDGTATPRTIEFLDGVSDIGDANPDNFGATENACRIQGVLSQTSTPALDL